jgi:cysteine-rich repeat protein
VAAVVALSPACSDEGASADSDISDASSTSGGSTSGPGTSVTTTSDTEDSATTGDEPRCGDGVVDPGETCDDGNDENDDACTTACQPPECGDGWVQPSIGEDCDDGNTDDVDACPADCTQAICGDGIVEGLETCDPGETVGDGLSDCSGQCTTNACGDGYVHQPSENCDDGNTEDGDGCNATCTEAFVTQLAVGDHYTCALLATGAVRCWGENQVGSLGYGNLEDVGDDETPASVGDVDVGGEVIQISAGWAHTCAVLASGSVRCWGAGSGGLLGYGNEDNIGDDETPASAGDVDVGGTVTQVAAGQLHTCALLAGGTVRCWGEGGLGELGYGDTQNIGDDETPASAGDVDVGGTVVQITAGVFGTCALLESGTVRCWGDNSLGSLGYPQAWSVGDGDTPADVGDVDTGLLVQQVSMGGSSTCALTTSGTLRCWGVDLPYGTGETIGDDETPADAGDVDVGGQVAIVAAGNTHACALLTGGNVRCWGRGERGPLGYGNTEAIGDDETPADAGDVDVGATVVQIGTGVERTCVVTASGTVRCWGSGVLGYGEGGSIGDDEVPASAGDIDLY